MIRGKVASLCEGEFDGLPLWQEAGNLTDAWLAGAGLTAKALYLAYPVLVAGGQGRNSLPDSSSSPMNK